MYPVERTHIPNHGQRETNNPSSRTIHTIFALAEAGITSYGIVNREFVVCLMAVGVLTFHIGFIYADCVQKRYNN